MRLNLKRFVPVLALLGLAATIVACTATAGNDTICIGRDENCRAKSTAVPHSPSEVPESFTK